MLATTMEQLIDKNMLIPVVAIGGGLLVAIVSIICSAIRSTAIGRSREQTKRELAAYVAEGTLDPDKALAMINAGKKSGTGNTCC